MEKLSSVISFILQNSPGGRSRLELAKLAYFCDGVFFQHNSSIITDQKYVHLEDCPMPLQLLECLLHLRNENFIDVKPKLNGTGVSGFLIFNLKQTEDLLSRDEKRIIRKVLEAFRRGVFDESKQYPNLYENYVITPLFSEIKITTDTINTKIHFLKKKSLLTISGRIFRVLFN
ncbi:MAG: DUF4065 domain-containing protein [Leptospira sp.]|nr:DUF4065 domain-containing protein [Leptospira sp.]